LQFLGNRAESWGVATGDDTGEEVDIGRQLHAPQFLDIRISTRRFISGDGLDLTLAEESSLGVDLLGSQDMSLIGWLPQYGTGACEECHMAHLEGLVGDFPLRCFCGVRRSP